MFRARRPATLLARYDGDCVQCLVSTRRKRAHHAACRLVLVYSVGRLGLRNVSSIFRGCLNLVSVCRRECSSKLCGVLI